MIALAGARILVVDDVELNRRLLERILESEGYAVESCAGAGEALAAIDRAVPDLVLSDVRMPGIDGIALTRMLRSDPRTEAVPVVLVTASEDHQLRLEGLEAGAEDFLQKPIHQREAVARVRNLIRMKRLHDLLRRDLAQLSDYDPATGLANAEHLQRIIAERMAAGSSPPPRSVVLELTALDKYLPLLDRAGVATLLGEVVDRLKASIPEDAPAGRLDAGRFAVVLEDPDDTAARLQHAFTLPFVIGELEVLLEPRLGISDGESADAGECLRQARVAARDGGSGSRRDLVRHYRPDMEARARRRLLLQSHLAHAVEREELFLEYQPQVGLTDGRLLAAEALVRWNHGVFGIVSPAEFIPVAEQSGLIVPIGAWVLEQACRVCRQWRDRGHPRMRVAVNLSPRQLYDPELPATISDALARNDLPADALVLELTESAMMENLDEGVRVLANLHELGVRLSVDDFGTGYSSLAYLSMLPLHELKVDRSFVSALPGDHHSALVTRSVIGLALNLGLDIVAEGIEKQSQLEYLLNLGCTTGQGYLLGRPTTAAQILEHSRGEPARGAEHGAA